MKDQDFWTRRRAAVRDEAAAEAAAADAARSAAAEAALAERTDEDLLAELNLAMPEDLNDAGSVRAFLKADLPQRLKRRAIRQLWKLNPMLANLDGLVDYGEDYTDAATVMDNLQTAYQVGKGMFDKLAESEEPSIAEHPEESEGQGVEDAAADALAGEPAPSDNPENNVVAMVAGPVGLPSEDLPGQSPGTRRMRFEFET